jgi:hypothetical protein
MRDSPTLAIGILLAVLGAAILGYQGITYTTHDTVVDVGPVKVTTEKEKTVPISPILGGVALAGGVGMIVICMRKS